MIIEVDTSPPDTPTVVQSQLSGWTFRPPIDPKSWPYRMVQVTSFFLQQIAINLTES